MKRSVPEFAVLELDLSAVGMTAVMATAVANITASPACHRSRTYMTYRRPLSCARPAAKHPFRLRHYRAQWPFPREALGARVQTYAYSYQKSPRWPSLCLFWERSAPAPVPLTQGSVHDGKGVRLSTALTSGSAEHPNALAACRRQEVDLRYGRSRRTSPARNAS